MSMRSTSCSPPRHFRAAAGLTLIEVVAGLALMASVLTSLLYARTRYARTLHNADLRVRACAAADTLLASWRSANHAPPAAGSGEIVDDSRLRWQTTVVKNEVARQLGASVVRLSIMAADRPTINLAAVEVVVPAKAREN